MIRLPELWYGLSLQNEQQLQMLTDFFCRALPAGQSAMSVRHLAYHGSTQAVIVVQGDTTHVHIRLAWQELELGEIRVTARSSRNTSEAGSVSVVERAAIDHLQASSLADILQLIPGQLAVNPGLSGAQQALIRQVPTTAEAARNNALGTSIILDGAPVSNNANLQQDVTILNASPGSLPPFSSVAGRGTDLRDIPADLIERVEVIRGIPSARHGDVAAGTILVQTRGGAMRPALQVRFSPTLTEASFRTGFGDGVRRRGDIHCIEPERCATGSSRGATELLPSESANYVHTTLV